MTPSLISLAALIVSAAALAGVISAWWSLYSLNKLRRSFFTGKMGADLEQAIMDLTKQLGRLEGGQKVLEESLQRLQTNFNLAVQKLGVVRFNPFGDGGGNFSFSLALLDGQNSGLVITSMHGREQNRIYSKKIENGKSESTLTEEERQAVMQAIDYHNKQIIYPNKTKTAYQ